MQEQLRAFKELLLMSLRNLKQRRARTALTVLGVAIGVSAIVSIGIAKESALNSITDVIDKSAGRSDISVTNALGGLTDSDGFDAEVLKIIQDLPQVAEAAPLLQVTTMTKGELDDWEMSIFVGNVDGTIIYGVNPQASYSIEHYRIQTGIDLSSAIDDGILLTKSYARSLGVNIGNTVEFVTSDGVARFQVVGFLPSEGLATMNNGEVAIANLETAARFFEREGQLDQIDLVATEDSNIEDLKYEIQETLGPGYRVVSSTEKGNETKEWVDLLSAALGFVGSIVILLGIYLIYNTFATTVTERTRDLALMRALGASRGQLLSTVLGEAILLGVVGSIAGIFVGIGLALGLREMMSTATEIEMSEFVILMDHVVSGLVIGVFVALFAALFPAIQASRLTPIEALRSYQSESRRASRWYLIVAISVVLPTLTYAVVHIFESSDVTWDQAFLIVLLLLLGFTLLIARFLKILEPATNRIPFIFGLETKLGWQNLTRKPGRTAFAAGALMIGVVAVILNGSATEAMDSISEDYLDITAGSDVFVYSSQPLPQSFVNDIGTMPDVSAAVGVSWLPTRMVRNESQSEEFAIFVATDHSLYEQGNWGFIWVDDGGDKLATLARIQTGEAVIIDSRLAEVFGMAIGDFITLQSLQGPVEFEIVGVVYAPVFGGYSVHGTYDMAQQYFGTNEAELIKLMLEPGATFETVSSTINDNWGEQYNLKIESFSDYRSRALGSVEKFNATGRVLIAICVVIVLLGVLNSMLMSIWERRRELGMLRAVGMTRSQVLKLILAEAVALGMIGGGIGVILGLLCSRLIVISFNTLTEIGIDYPYVFPVPFLIIGILIMLLVPPIGGLLPAWRATKTNMVEAMRTE